MQQGALAFHPEQVALIGPLDNEPFGSAGAVALAFLFLYIGFWGESLSTVWFCSAVCLHLAALIGLGLEYCLERRGPGRSLPRIDVLW